MVTKLAYAYTEPGTNFPPYVNVNRDENGQWAVIVRSPPKSDGVCGDTAQVSLTVDQAIQLADGILNVIEGK